MRARTRYARGRSFADYGARGIRVCARWESFSNFLADMGSRPSSRHSLERIDNDGHYEPGNCKWATLAEQARNRRNNRRLTYAGETLTLVDWSERTNITKATIWERLRRGWSVERALTTPVRPHTCTRGRQFEWDGRSLTLTAWSREVGLSTNTIRARLDRGWRLSDALTRPLQRGRRATASP
jgi:hypothetical protein